MAAFELQDNVLVQPETALGQGPEMGHKRFIDECIVAYKVYDSCRRQNCLTPRELGPAMYARSEHGDGLHQADDTPYDDREEFTTRAADDAAGLSQGPEPVRPPNGAVSVTIDKLTVSKITVVDKQPSPFRNGYWDVAIKYVFGYELVFRNARGRMVETVEATNQFDMRVTLFGSRGGDDLVIGTDLYPTRGGTSTFPAAPFIWTEAKAVALDAKICHNTRETVLVTIGLFSVLKLVRLVHLNVQSTGFCIPNECEDPGADINPCEYFADLDFPLDIFSPPQKPEFFGNR